MLRSFTYALCSLTVVIHLVYAQTTTSVGTNDQVDPNAECPYQINDQIQQCRTKVYDDEAKLPGGPCASTDWACICNVQQGLIACYYPCRGSTPATDIYYNNAHCNGQNGYVNEAAASTGIPYMGSPITTDYTSVLSSSTLSGTSATFSTVALSSSTSTASSNSVTSPTSSPSSATSRGTILTGSVSTVSVVQNDSLRAFAASGALGVVACLISMLVVAIF